MPSRPPEDVSTFGNDHSSERWVSTGGMKGEEDKPLTFDIRVPRR